MLRALALVLLLVGVGLAGCLGATPDLAPASTVDASAAALNVTTIGVVHSANGALAAAGATMTAALGGSYHIGGPAFEPTLGVDKKGNVYVAGVEPAPQGPAAAAAPDGGGTVYMSSDKGMTWKDKGPQLPTGTPAHTVSFDPFLYVDVATGRVFSDDIWPLGCGAMAWSDDQGTSWTNNPAACGNPQVNDHQSIVAAKPRAIPAMPVYPNVLYRCVNNVGDAACATSLTGGLTWGPQVVAMPGIEQSAGDSPQPLVCGGLTGHLAAAPDGTVYLPRGGCGYAEVAVTQDDGVTWTTHIINRENKTDDHEVRVAVDEAGTAYATWMSNGTVVMSSSKDAGKKWSPAIVVEAPGVTAAAFNAVAAGAPGKVAIAYLGTTFPGGYAGKKTADDWKGATWNGYLTIITNATDENPTLQSVTVNDPSDPLARGQCGHTRCNGMFDFIDVKIDSEGRPWAVWDDVCTKTCVGDATAKNDAPMGLVGTLRAGPTLRGADGALAMLPAQVSK